MAGLDIYLLDMSNRYMQRESRTPYVILGILGVLEPKALSGYDIKQIIDGTISHFWAESFGQIYPVLKKLTAEKLIQAKSISEKGRKKILYTLTAKGGKRLAAWLEIPPVEGPRREELILKLFFGSKTRIPVLIRHLEARRNAAKAIADQYAGGLNMLQTQGESYTPFHIITLRGGIAMSKAFVEWADESLAELNRMRRSR
jgi:PadR family transcriptional regulator, regulatory protein AphA